MNVTKLDDLLIGMLEHKASDLHLSANHPPYLRLHGDMTPMPEYGVLSSDQIHEILKAIMPEGNREEFARNHDTDFAYPYSEHARFRVNMFMDRLGVGAVLRTIPATIPTSEDLNLPKVIREFCKLSKGLVVVTGPTGSGKSTTLAAMIDLINRQRNEHIITIEDPIEFVHQPIRCLINQREVHRHTKSFSAALRAALREDPDIVLVGEMRDLETIEIAIETAETGHLVFGTLHTNTAPTTVNRIIDKFPADRQNQIRTMLADSLRGVIAQTLCRRSDGKGRVAAFEILISTTAIAANIREGKTYQIASAMQTGRAAGMVNFNDSLIELAKTGQITPEEAYLRAVEKADMRKMLEAENLPGFEREDTNNRKSRRGPKEPPVAPLSPQEAQRKVWRDALRLNPDDIEALTGLALSLATATDERMRNGRESVQLAEQAYALTGGQDLGVLDTLAAAYAEANRFKRAITIMGDARTLAERLNNPAVLEAIDRQTEQYRQHQPLRETQS